MHELGVLRQVMKTVNGIAEKNRIERIKFITLDVGTESTYVPRFFEKLFPIATDTYPVLQQAQLRMNMVPGKGLTIKEIGY